MTAASKGITSDGTSPPSGAPDGTSPMLAAPGRMAQRRAAALIESAAHADRVAFGRAYGALIEPELDTDAVAWLLSFLQAAYADVSASESTAYPAGAFSADGAAAIDADSVLLDRVRRMAGAAFGVCSELVEVNLAVLEHVLRSVLSVSDYLASIDGYTAALYAGALAGGLQRAAWESGFEFPTAVVVLAAGCGRSDRTAGADEHGPPAGAQPGWAVR